MHILFKDVLQFLVVTHLLSKLKKYEDIHSMHVFSSTLIQKLKLSFSKYDLHS